MRWITRVFLACLLGFGAPPAAWASVTITFWSHDMGNSFPHAFFTLRGVPDSGGAPVDANYGFTAKSVSPAILFGNVDGRIDIVDTAYMSSSDAQFSLSLTDAQYAGILKLVDEWGENGDHHYNLNHHNCVDFVEEAARRSGLVGLDQPKLMKKPKSYLLAVEAANAGHVTIVGQPGKAYLASLSPIVPEAPGDGDGAKMSVLPVAAATTDAVRQPAG